MTETARTPDSSSDPDEYARQVARESDKWGRHLQVEASGEWNAWLDHPAILAHYRGRALVDGLSWENWVPQYLNVVPERSLDLGCGSGGRSLALWEKGASRFIEGMDVSEERVAEGERRRAQAGARGQFRVADANTAALSARTYDLVFSAHSFHHFLKLEYVMQQVSQALTDRGLFVLEEYVGPTQFQWTDLQLKYVADLLESVPPRLRTYRNGILKASEGRPSPDEVVAVSPFESIRSAEIWPLFQRYFDVVQVRKLGGTIQHLLYNGIVHNFDPADPLANQHLERILGLEDRLVDAEELPSDFMLLVGRRRDG